MDDGDGVVDFAPRTQGTDTLPSRTFDKLRSIHRSPVVENKRLDDMLSIVAEMQAA